MFSKILWWFYDIIGIMIYCKKKLQIMLKLKTKLHKSWDGAEEKEINKVPNTK